MVQPTFEGQVPEIDYPCDWTLQLIARDEAELRAAVEALVPEPFRLERSRTSRTGKYVSFQLVFRVHSHEERRGIGQSLHDHPAVLLVF